MNNIKTYVPIFGSVADFVGSKWFNFAGNQPDAFPMDIIERSDEYEIRVVVPGANKDGLAVEVEGDVLHINVVGNNNNPEDLFGTEAANKWAELAFSNPLSIRR